MEESERTGASEEARRILSHSRVGSFSDGVFAVIITIMVLQLRLPAHPTFAALFDEWPTALSYVVSYLLIAIMWINHHFLLRSAGATTARLTLWIFAHMFAASLVPFATAWMADTRFAPVPVFIYAAGILFVNFTYHGFAHEAIGRSSQKPGTLAMRRRALARSYVTIALFTLAMILALFAPLIAFALVTCVLLTYARPQIPGFSSQADGFLQL
ncbi:MAG TPA: TMEM175 family protein [Candidatus Sulfotelmatobacter sp.]|nr:TMEM175 family protein [Candidatus Sulfotelmatobacter sp.]